jgi:hypothetical protein
MIEIKEVRENSDPRENFLASKAPRHRGSRMALIHAY